MCVLLYVITYHVVMYSLLDTVKELEGFGWITSSVHQQMYSYQTACTIDLVTRIALTMKILLCLAQQCHPLTVMASRSCSNDCSSNYIILLTLCACARGFQ